MNKLELIEKIKEFPDDMEVKFMTNYEVCGDDDHTYWLSNSITIEKSMFCLYNERVYYDKDDLREDIADNYYDNEQSEKEHDKLVDDEFNRINIETVILIRLDN